MQLSLPGSIDEWEDPVQLQPPGNYWHVIVRVIDGLCVSYMAGTDIFLVRSVDEQGLSWSDPVRLNGEYLATRRPNSFDLQEVAAQPMLAFFGSEPSDTNNCRMYISVTDDGETWAVKEPLLPLSLSYFYLLVDSVHLTEYEGMPGILYNADGQTVWMEPEDQQLLNWTFEQVDYETDYSEIAQHQPGFSQGEAPLAAAKVSIDPWNSPLVMMMPDDQAPGGWQLLEIPLDYEVVTSIHPHSMILVDEAPIVALWSADHEPDYTYHQSRISLAQASDSSMSNWTRTVFCGDDSFQTIKLAQLDGELVAFCGRSLDGFTLNWFALSPGG